MPKANTQYPVLLTSGTQISTMFPVPNAHAQYLVVLIARANMLDVTCSLSATLQ